MIIKKLDNGITVIGDYMPHAKSAAIGFFVKAGSVDEDSSNYGISHMISLRHLTFLVLILMLSLLRSILAIMVSSCLKM